MNVVRWLVGLAVVVGLFASGFGVLLGSADAESAEQSALRVPVSRFGDVVVYQLAYADETDRGADAIHTNIRFRIEEATTILDRAGDAHEALLVAKVDDRWPERSQGEYFLVDLGTRDSLGRVWSRADGASSTEDMPGTPWTMSASPWAGAILTPSGSLPSLPFLVQGMDLIPGQDITSALEWNARFPWFYDEDAANPEPLGRHAQTSFSARVTHTGTIENETAAGVTYEVERTHNLVGAEVPSRAHTVEEIRAWYVGSAAYPVVVESSWTFRVTDMDRVASETSQRMTALLAGFEPGHAHVVWTDVEKHSSFRDWRAPPDRTTGGLAPTAGSGPTAASRLSTLASGALADPTLTDFHQWRGVERPELVGFRYEARCGCATDPGTAGDWWLTFARDPTDLFVVFVRDAETGPRHLDRPAPAPDLGLDPASANLSAVGRHLLDTPAYPPDQEPRPFVTLSDAEARARAYAAYDPTGAVPTSPVLDQIRFGVDAARLAEASQRATSARMQDARHVGDQDMTAADFHYTLWSEAPQASADGHASVTIALESGTARQFSFHSNPAPPLLSSTLGHGHGAAAAHFEAAPVAGWRIDGHLAEVAFMTLALAALTVLAIMAVHAGWVGGFSRIEPHTALRNPTRRAVYEKVMADPGANLSEVATAVGLSLPAASRHLDVLARNGFVKSTRPGRSRHFFPVETGTHESAQLTVLRDATARALYDRIGRHGSCTRRQLAKGAGITVQAVAWQLRRMEGAGLIVAETSGHTHLYRRP